MSYQANDVVEALVREYLVRAGCSAALESFNREKPKHANSITKREVLRKSLGLDKAAAYYKKQNPTADGLPSTLEVWVIHQMAKLGAAPPEAGLGPIPMPAPRLAAAPGRIGGRAATEPDEVSVPMVATGLPRRPASGQVPAASGVGAAASSSSAASPGAVPAWRHRAGLDPLRRGSGRKAGSKRNLAALKSPAAAAAAASPPPPLTANRSRRSLARPPSIKLMPRIAPPPQASKPPPMAGGGATASAAASQLPALPLLPPVRGAAKCRPPSHTKEPKHPQQYPPHPLHPHAHAHAHAASGPGPPSGAHPHAHAHGGFGHAHGATAAAGNGGSGPSVPSSSSCCGTPQHKGRPTASGYPSPALTNAHWAAHAAASPYPAAAATPFPAAAATPFPAAAASSAAAEPDLRASHWLATAANSPGQGGPSRPTPARQGFGFGEGSAPRPAAPAPAPPVRRGSTPSYNDDSDEDEPEIIHAGAATRGSAGFGPGVRASQPSAMHHSASASNVPLRTSAPGLGFGGSGAQRTLPTASRASSGASAVTAPLGGAGGSGSFMAPPSRTAAPVAAAGRSPGPGLRPGAAAASRSRALAGGEMVMEDLDDLNFDDDDGGGGGPTAAAGGIATMRISGPATRKPGTPISPEVMRQVKALLWGAQGGPPPSWKQGFFFNRHPGLQFGLTQRQGGPCGVLAAVQALILTALHSPATGFTTSPRAPEQQSALASALTESLWQARMGPTAALVLPEGEAGGAAGRLGYEQLSRAVAQHTASTREALLDLVRGSLSVLMSEEGWGVVLFVMSLALSRGVDNIRADMDEPNNSLMGMHGYCTQELVNLIVLGVAHSNVFDGNKQLDGSTVLKGISRRCRVGLLTLFEWYKYVEVGPSLKNPALPVWVVCSESHFTVLFAQDSRALQNQLPFDLFYYDELANQEAIIKLSVAKDPRGGWSARVGSTFGDRGKCEGQNIPPLECVIETRWPGVKVNWNGHDPIL